MVSRSNLPLAPPGSGWMIQPLSAASAAEAAGYIHPVGWTQSDAVSSLVHGPGADSTFLTIRREKSAAHSPASAGIVTAWTQRRQLSHPFRDLRECARQIATWRDCSSECAAQG
ncbi:MAG: hypothetical protein M1296_02800 [Chloroflexi bacterium]|nr:hypothetical protein [Chloroflexota bacterium]